MRRFPPAAAAIALAGAVAVAGAFARSDAPPQRKRGFTISGSVQGLYPGSAVWLRATVRNPHARPMRLLSLDVSVRGVRRCAASNIDVRPFRGRLLIPRRSSRAVRLRVRMPVTAAPECQGARFPLAFRGEAVLR